MRLPRLLLLSAIVVPSLQPPANPSPHADLRVTRTLNGARLRFGGIAAPALQVFVVGGPGLRVFRHERLEPQRDRSVAVDLILPDAGLYMAFAEFAGANGWTQMLQEAFTIGSVLTPRPGEPADEPHESNGMSATMDLSRARAGRESTLAFDLSDESPSSSADAFVVSADLTEAQHLVARSTSQGAHLVFTPIFPRSGRYKVWLIVQRPGQTAAIPFVIDVN